MLLHFLNDAIRMDCRQDRNRPAISFFIENRHAIQYDEPAKAIHYARQRRLSECGHSHVFFVPFVRNRKRIYSFIRHTDYPNLVPAVSTLEFNALRFIVPMCFDPSRIVSHGNRYGY